MLLMQIISSDLSKFLAIAQWFQAQKNLAGFL